MLDPVHGEDARGNLLAAGMRGAGVKSGGDFEASVVIELAVEIHSTLGGGARGFGHQPGDAPAMAGDYDGGATLDLIEQLRQMGLCLRGLRLAQPLTARCQKSWSAARFVAQPTMRC